MYEVERTEAAPRQSHDGYQLLVPGDEATAVKEVRIFMRVVVKLQSFKRWLSEGSRILTVGSLPIYHSVLIIVPSL